MTPDEARAIIRNAADERSNTDVVLLATLIQFGTSETVVYSRAANVLREPGDAPGTTALRPVSSAESGARADALTMYRSVARVAGVAMQPPGAMGVSNGKR